MNIRFKRRKLFTTPFCKGARGFSSLNSKAYSLITIPETYATDYTERIITTFWKKLWILLESGSNNPIQENLNLRSSWLDIVTATWSYKAVFSSVNTTTSSWIIIWTWSILSQSNPTSSCKRILESWLGSTNWVYIINPTWTSFSVYCDMIIDWGWWIRIENNISSSDRTSMLSYFSYTDSTCLECNWI